METVPVTLSSIKPYLMITRQFKTKDPVMSFYALQYAVQEGITLSKSDPAAKAFLKSLLDQLEIMKKGLAREEALTNEVVAVAHVEAVGLRLFHYAEQEDRNSHFHKNMIKAFFTSSHIFSILTSFGEGELSEEVESKQKYAKWKAVEIDRCLKSGISPTPGPPGEATADEGFSADIVTPAREQQREPSPRPTPKPRHNVAQPDVQPLQQPQSTTTLDPQPQEPVATIAQETISQAQKMCKFASSALDYDDVSGAVDYLTQALQLLKK